jgi:hypothetical protein
MGFCGFALIVSSAVKLWGPAAVVDYMGSMGYTGGTYLLIAGMEILIGALLLLPRTRPIGLLLGSAYFGSAVAAHVAIHRYLTGGPFLVYTATHPYVGALFPATFLALLWIGARWSLTGASWWPRTEADAGDASSDRVPPRRQWPRALPG